MAYELPQVPYDMDALQPYISKETLEYHYGKHHAAYVNNLNKLVEGTAFANASLEDIVKGADGGIFNNGAQVWNHTFYWNCMSPEGNREPSGALLNAIKSLVWQQQLFLELVGHGWLRILPANLRQFRRAMQEIHYVADLNPS